MDDLRMVRSVKNKTNILDYDVVEGTVSRELTYQEYTMVFLFISLL